MVTREPDMTYLNKFVNEWGPERIAAVLDEVMFCYADHLIRGCDELIPSSHDADNLWYLKELRDEIWKTIHSDEPTAG